MLDWLKDILGNAYSEEIDQKISSEVGRGFVAKGDFHAVKDELKRLKGELETKNRETEEWEKLRADRDELRKIITDRENTIRQLRVEAETGKKTAAVREKLRQLGAVDPDYLIYKQGGIERFSFGEDGSPLQLEELADSYKSNTSTAFLFPSESAGYSPVGGVCAAENPFAKETFNLTEQGKLLRRDPAAARKMAAAAKINL